MFHIYSQEQSSIKVPCSKSIFTDLCHTVVVKTIYAINKISYILWYLANTVDCLDVNPNP